tara:strand:- start:623 stop:1003 length:381 start_codon:yes stop_codon:yes gene_type:complete
MKTILVDAVYGLVTLEGINQELLTLLDSYQNPKIILTNANDEEKAKYGLVNLPYPLFSLAHNPNKTDPEYYRKMLAHFNLTVEEVIYFEHNEDAVKSAQSVGITSHHYDKDKKDLVALKEFLDSSL